MAEGATEHFEVAVAGSTAAGSVKIQYSVSGTAVAGEDYTALSGEATVAKGENVARIALEALKDGILDKGETVVLALTGATGPGTVLVDQTAATATIADNGSVTVALAAVSDTIGEGSTWNSSVLMSMPVADRISLRWRTQDGTALAGRDYEAADEVVTFQPGETVKPISVETLEDDNTEAVEVFYVSLGLAVDAARAGTEGAFKVDAKPQSAFIECSVVFPPNVQTMFELVAPVPADTVIGTVAANTTGGIPYYELDDGDENKFTINSLTAQISTTAALDPGLYELEVKVHDECGAQASIDVSVNVKQPNRPPVVDNEIEDMTLYVGDDKEIDLSKVFSDPDEDVLSYEAVSSKPAVATAVVSGTTLTVTAKGQGETTVTVTAKDPDDLEVTDVFKVTVPNRSPKPVGTIEPDTINIDESKSVDVSSYFKDPDGDQLTYTARSSNPRVATVVVSGSEVTYTGEAEGRATVTVTARDPGGLSTVQSFEVVVEDPNDAPEPVGRIPDDTVTVGQSKSVDVLSKFHDPNGDKLTYTVESSKSTVVDVNVDGSEVTYEGLKAGSAEVTVKATDPGGLFAEQVFTVTVLPPACDIDFDDSDFTVPEDATDVGTVSVTAEHCGVLDYALTGAGANDVSVAAASGGDDAKITGDFNFEVRESYALMLSVSERDGSASLSKSVSITVTDVNEQPVVEDEIDDQTLYVGEGRNEAEITLTDVFSDPDGDILGYTVKVSNTDVATATVSGNTLTVTAKGKGNATVTVTATDQGNLAVVDVFAVEVPNRKPTAKGTISDRGVDVGQSGSVNASSYFTDPDKDELDYSVTSSKSSVVEVSINGSRVTYKGLKEGAATVTVTAKDTWNLTARQQFEVEVYEPTQDCKITVSAAQLSVREDAGVGDEVDGEVGVSANADCGTLRYALSGTGSGDFSVAGASDDAAKIKVERGLNHEGRDSYDLTLTVNSGSVSHAADVDISVTDVNEAPRSVGTIRARTVRIGRPGSVDVTGYFTDEDAGDRLTFTSKSSVTGRLTVNASGSPVTLTGVAAGDATVTVTARDRGGLTATQVFSVTVEPAPKPCGITVSDAALAVPEDAGVGTEVSGVVGVSTTGDCGTLRYALTGTASGDFSVAAAGATDDDGKVKVRRGLNHEGRDSYDLTLTVSEAVGTATGAGDVDISVTDVNEAPKPSGSIGTRTVRIGHPQSVDVTGYFTDEDDGDRLTFTSESSAPGRLTVNASESPVTLTGVAVGSAAVTVTARDRGGLTATQVFSVKVDPAPKPCEITVSDGALSVREDAGLGDGLDGSVGVATKGDCGTLSYSLTGTGSGDFSVAAAGASDDDAKIGVARALDHETKASYALTLTVRWGTVSDTGAVDISVTDVNEAPEVASAIPALTVAATKSRVVDVSAHFTDPDGDALTYGAGSSKEGIATVAAVGSEVTVTGVSEGESEVTVTARDPHGAEVSQAFAVTVGPENAAPEVASAIPALTVAAGETAVVDVSGRFRDPDGDPLSYGAESSKEGVATVAASGSEVTVTGVSRGESRVTVTASDGRGGSASQAFAVTVPNRAPAFAGKTPSRSVAENSVAGTDVGAPVTASDADGDPLSYSLASGGAASSFAVGPRTGQLTVAAGAALDYEGGDTLLAVSVLASDGVLADTAKVTVRVTDVPVPGRPAKPSLRGGQGVLKASWKAPPNAGPAITGYDLGYRIASSSNDWTEVSPGDVLEHTLRGLAAGTVYRVRVRAVSAEGEGEWSEAGRSGTSPLFDPAAVTRSVPENSPAGAKVGAPVTAEAGEGVVLSYDLAGRPPAEFAIDAATGQITVAGGAALDYERGPKVYRVTVAATYSLGGEALGHAAAVTIRVTDVPAPGKPSAPVVTGGAEQVEVSWSAPANEGPAIGGYDLRYRAKASSGWTEVSASGTALAHTIAGLEAGTAYLVQVRAKSSEGAGEWSDSGEGTTEGANRAPSFGEDAYEREVPENSVAGTAVGDPVTATDADQDDLTYGFVAGSNLPFAIDAGTGRIEVAAGAALDHEGEANSYAVQVEASDGTLADTAAVTIRVTDVPAPGKPDAPTVTGGAERVEVSWSAPSNEGPAIGGYDLRYRAKASSGWTEVSLAGSESAHAITGLAAGTTYLVQVRAVSSEGAGEWSDPGEGTAAKANEAPSFAEDAYEREVPENSAPGTAVGDPVTATDADDDDLTYSFLLGGAEIPFEIDAGTGRIEVAAGAALDYEGEPNSYAVQVEASDGTLADTVGVTIRVTDVPAPGKPDAPAVAGGRKEAAVTWSAPANEGPAIMGYDYRYRAEADSEWSDPAGLEVVLAHTITGLKAGTTYLVQVRAVSSEGAGEWSDPGEGTTKANAAPSFAEDAYEREVPENSAAGAAVGDPVTATDADGDGLTYSFLPGGEVPFEIGSASGRITVAEGAALNHESADTLFTVRVEASDGTLADTASVTIRVTNADDPGTVTLDPEVARVGVEMTATLTDEDGVRGADTSRKWQRSAHGSAWNDVGSRRIYTPVTSDAGMWLRVVFTYSDGHGPGKRAVSEAVQVQPGNAAPSFAEDAYEREVPENSPGGTAVGEPVTATDADDDGLTYSFLPGGEVPFEIGSGSGRITVAEGAALNYESADTLYAVRVEASDGELADTASVTVRVINADEPGTVVLNPETARVGVELTVELTDEDGVLGAGRKRRWQRSRNGNSWSTIATGRMYNPVTSDEGKWLRVVFTYTDGHGPGKRAESGAVKVLAANRAPAFGKDAYERSVPENSPGGTNVGRPVQAEDDDGDELGYSLLAGSGAPFGIDAATGRITVAEDAALNYESADTLYTVHVEASDGTLADTASVTIRVKNADDPGEVALNPGVARVGVELTATLTDEDGVLGAGRKRKWQRSADGNSWRDIATGGAYNPLTGDEGKWLRAVFTYRDGHGPGKRAESEAVKVLPANAAPSFPAVYEREVPENSPGGTKVGAPVAATDPDGTSPSYSLVPGGDEDLFGIDSSTGQITVAAGAALDYESGDTLLAVRVEASDGELADTASVKVRVTNADDPGTIALSADVARVGVRLTATLTDQDRSIERSKMRTWQRSPDGTAWTMVVQGAERRFYTPTEADRGKYLRAVFTYSDGHGPGKRAESPAVMVVGATTPVVSFGAESYTAAPGGSADVAVLLSPAASSALAIEVVAGADKHTATFQTGASTATLAVSTAGLSASDTVAVRFGDLPEGVAVGVPATTRIIVAATAGDRVSRSVAQDGSRTELEVEYAQAEFSAVAGGPGTEIALRVSPAADRRVAVPLTATHASSAESMLPDSVVFQPGDSLAMVTLDVPAGTGSALLALGFGTLPEAVIAGAVASATVDIADRDAGLLQDEAFEVGLAVFGRAVAEGARQAVGARIDAAMRPAGGGSGAAVPRSAAEWAGRAAGTLASLTGAPLNASSAADMARRSGSVDLPTGRETARRLLPSLSFATALGPQSAEGRPRIGLWAEGSAQSFRGEPGIDYDGGLRALAVGADARIGSSTLFGVSLMRSDGDLDYGHRSAEGSLGHAMNSVHPYLFLQPSPRIGLWAMAGYGTGDVRDDDRHGDTGASLRMLSGGVKVPLARSGAFGLSLNGDAFTVGMRADDGGREGSASRARALLEASWTAGGLRLATQAGARYDGGDADSGGGAETGASIGYAGHGLDLDLRGRLGLGSGRHREWGAALRLAFDPGARGEGFRLAVSPRHGRDQSGIHGLMDDGTLNAMAPATGRDWRLDAEAGYGLRNPGGGGALDGYTRLSADGRNRSWSFGTRYSVSQTLRLGIEGSRNRMPGQDPNLGIRFALDFTF